MKHFAKIYKVLCNCGCEKVYIGSTKSPLPKRLAFHKYKSDTDVTSKLHIHMKDVGKDCFGIELLDEDEFEDINEQHIREDEYIDKFDSIKYGYNCRYAHRTIEQKRTASNANYKKWVAENKDKAAEFKRQHRLKNIDHYHELERIRRAKPEAKHRRKLYEDSVREERLLQRKSYRENNQAAIRQRDALYRSNNKDRINKIKRERIKCECGKDVQRTSMTRHRRTYQHLYDFIVHA